MFWNYKKKIIIVTILIGIILFSHAKADNITFFFVRFFNKQISVSNFTFKLPPNWVAVKKGMSLTLIRRPEDSGTISLGPSKASESSIKKGFFVDERGERKSFSQVEQVQVGNDNGTAGIMRLTQKTIEVTIVLESHKLMGYFTGTDEAYSELLIILKNANKRSW